MQVEMGDPPYEERRKALIAKTVLNIYSHDAEHPAIKSLSDDFNFLYYEKNIDAKKKPLRLVCDDVLNQFNVNLNEVYIQKESPTPPWHLILPTVNTQLHNFISKQDLPALIKSHSDLLIDTQYQQFLKIFTDGSKDPVNQNQDVVM